MINVNLTYIRLLSFLRFIYFYRFRGLLIFLRLLGRSGLANVKIPNYRQNNYLRRGTSDIAVFEAIHAFNELNYKFEISAKGVILDCGANIGISTTYFAEKYPDALIIALEPVSTNFELLKKNTQSYENIICLQAAIWSYSGELFLQNPNAPSWSFRFDDKRNRMNADNEPAEAISMHDLMGQYQIEHIDLMKIDIEGAEKSLFTQGSLDWVSSVRTYVIELHDTLVPGCSCAFYKALNGIQFIQDILGEKVIIKNLSTKQNMSQDAVQQSIFEIAN